MGPLKGLRVIELAGIGPGPFCGMMLSDMGAEVVRVDRLPAPGARRGRDVLARNRRQRRRIGAVVFVLVGTHRRGDGEPGRHRQADTGHFREVCAFAAKGRAHGRPTIRAPRAEREDELTVGFRHAADPTTLDMAEVKFAWSRWGSNVRRGYAGRCPGQPSSSSMRLG